MQNHKQSKYIFKDNILMNTITIIRNKNVLAHSAGALQGNCKLAIIVSSALHRVVEGERH